jgi:hypothetical protein
MRGEEIRDQIRDERRSEMRGDQMRSDELNICVVT